MKTFLIILLLLCVSGCAAVNGTHFASGTIIGISAGLPDGVNIVIGFRRFEIATCEKEMSIDAGADGTIHSTGLDGTQWIKINSKETK